MKRLLLAGVFFCLASLPAFAQFGLYSGGGSGPTNLCNSYSSYVCLVAYADDYVGQPLKNYQMLVNGSTSIYTNGGSTPGWIVMISAANTTTSVEPSPLGCGPFYPYSASVYATTVFGASKYYYAAYFHGACTS